MDTTTLVVLVGASCGLLGLIVGSTATWAIKAGAELKAYKAKEEAAASTELAKVRLAAETDVQRVRVTAQEVGNFFRNLRTEFDAEKAKILNQADQRVAQAQTAAALVIAPPSPAPAPAPAAPQVPAVDPAAAPA